LLEVRSELHVTAALSLSGLELTRGRTLTDALDGGAVRVLADEAASLVTQRRAVTGLALLARTDGAATAAVPYHRASGRTGGLQRRALAGVGAVRSDLRPKQAQGKCVNENMWGVEVQLHRL
jgi:hypothetical protein